MLFYLMILIYFSIIIFFIFSLLIVIYTLLRMNKTQAKKYIQMLLLCQPGVKVDVTPVIHFLQNHPDYDEKIKDIDMFFISFLAFFQ